MVAPIGYEWDWIDQVQLASKVRLTCSSRVLELEPTNGITNCILVLDGAQWSQGCLGHCLYGSYYKGWLVAPDERGLYVRW